MQKSVFWIAGGIAILITTTLHGAVPQIAAGNQHSLGLDEKGLVRAFGSNTYGQCDVESWTDIVQIAAGGNYSVGLKSDGTVVAVGNNDFGQCDLGLWTDIVEISAGWAHTLGLRADGTVVAAGSNIAGQCYVEGWMDVAQVAAGNNHSLARTASLGVLATGANPNGQCNVGDWADIQFIAAGANHSLGVKSDGTVIAIGNNADGQCNVESWADIHQAAGGKRHSLGLKSDGTVVAVGDNGNGQCDVDTWKNIIQVASFTGHSLGLRDNGQPEAVGLNNFGQCDFGRWAGFQQPVALEILEEISTSEYVQHSDVSADGSVIIGGHSPGDGWRWEDDSAVILDGLYAATSISYDGSIVVGFSVEGPNNKKYAVVWREGSLQEYPNLPDSPGHVSGDGTVIVGADNDNLGIIFRWKDGEVTHLGRGYFAEGELASMDLSEDGSILIATSRKWVTGELRATIWVDGVMQDLGTMPGDDESTAMAISADGTMIVGSSINSSNGSQRPCFWKDGIIHELEIPPGIENCQATSVSMDGRVILGEEWEKNLILWTESSGWKPRIVFNLLAENGINFGGFLYNLLGPAMVRTDGSSIIIVGDAVFGATFNNPLRVFRIVISEESPTWAGYPIADELMNVDTGGFMRWLNVSQGDYVWSYSLNGWMYCPETNVTGSGAWVYVLK